jgi:hypothetical protein
MPPLATSPAVIARAGVERLPEYSDLIEITDTPGFAVRRAYPPDSDLAHVVNDDGQELIKALIQFMVTPASAPGGVSPVLLRAWVFPRHKAHKLFAALHELPPDDPDTPTTDSLQRWRLARKPEHVEIVGEFFYDGHEDRFFNTHGQTVEPAAMLDHVYQAHLRTLQTSFVWQRKAETFVHSVMRLSVMHMQDALMWAILHLYDVELTLPKEKLSPFHKFRFSDFLRAKIEPGGERSEFFGVVSSRRNLMTNLVVVGVVVALVYFYGPRTGLLRAIYRNDALTTGALVLTFFAVDYLGQLVLKLLIWGLSRLRSRVFFLPSLVKP